MMVVGCFVVECSNNETENVFLNVLVFEVRVEIKIEDSSPKKYDNSATTPDDSGVSSVLIEAIQKQILPSFLLKMRCG